LIYDNLNTLRIKVGFEWQSASLEVLSRRNRVVDGWWVPLTRRVTVLQGVLMEQKPRSEGASIVMTGSKIKPSRSLVYNAF